MPNSSQSSAADADFRRRQFDRAAENYDRHSAVQLAMAEELIQLLPSSVRARSVLEIGCGTGHLSELLLSRSEALLYLTDVSERMLTACRARLAGTQAGTELRFAKLDAAGSGLEESFAGLLARTRFDLVASNAVVQWFSDIRAHFAFVAQLLKPGAPYLCSGLSAGNFPELRSILQQAPFAYANLPGHDAPSMKEAADGAGFDVVSLVEREILQEYPTVESFLTTIRHSGASRFPQGPRLTADGLLRLKRLYVQHCANQGGIRATWTPWYALLRRR